MAARERIVGLLGAFTPDIEPCPFDLDALWVSVDGLRSLFASESCWIEKVRAALSAEGYSARIVLGFTRYGTYAIARSHRRSMAFSSPQEEHDLMSRSSIDILPLAPRIKGTLHKLEVRSVQQFVSLPAGEIEQRFGKEAALLRRSILSDDPLPIQPLAVKETLPCTRHLDAPLADLDLLIPHVEELLAIEASRAEAERSVISGLTVILRTEQGEATTDAIRPAVPTLKLPLLLRLVRLRLSARQFTAGVEDIEIRSTRTAPSRRQEELFTARGRDLQAGARAFAAIRARFGNESVSCARLADSHLPERSFRWVPMDRPVLPKAREEVAAAPEAPPTAVRRILFAPARLGAGSLDDMPAPFVVSGAWWATGAGEAPFHREYRYQGVLWVFTDRFTGVSWTQGVVD